MALPPQERAARCVSNRRRIAELGAPLRRNFRSVGASFVAYLLSERRIPAAVRSVSPRPEASCRAPGADKPFGRASGPS